MGADEFPLGMDFIGADVALVGCNADFLIDAGESSSVAGFTRFSYLLCSTKILLRSVCGVFFLSSGPKNIC